MAAAPPPRCSTDEDEAEGAPAPRRPRSRARAEACGLLRLALPSVLVQAHVFLLWLRNAAAAGTELGPEAMGAVALANLAGNLSALSLQYGLIFALESLASQAVGAGRHAEVGLLTQTCALGCAALLAPALGLWWHAAPLLVALGQPAGVAALAQRFLRVYAAGVPAFSAFEIGRRFLGCQGVMLPLVPITAAVAWGVHPALLGAASRAGLGFDGLALATVGSMWALCALSLGYTCARAPHDPRTWPGLAPRAALAPRRVGTFVRLALPGVLGMSEWWFWEATCFVVGVLGEGALAAHAIAYSLVPMLVMLPLGVAVAISVRVGQLVGAGEPARARALGACGVCAGMAPVCAYTLGVGLAPEATIGLFVPAGAHPAVRALARSLWPHLTAFLLFDGLFMLTMGAVRGAGLQLRAALAVGGALWGVGLPLVCAVAWRTGAGLRGVWASLWPTYALLDALLIALVATADWRAAAARAARHRRADGRSATPPPPRGAAEPAGAATELQSVPLAAADGAREAAGVAAQAEGAPADAPEPAERYAAPPR